MSLLTALKLTHYPRVLFCFWADNIICSSHVCNTAISQDSLLDVWWMFETGSEFECCNEFWASLNDATQVTYLNVWLRCLSIWASSQGPFRWLQKGTMGNETSGRFSNDFWKLDSWRLPGCETSGCAGCFLQFLSLKFGELFLKRESGLRLRSGLLLQHGAALFVLLLGFSQTKNPEGKASC